MNDPRSEPTESHLALPAPADFNLVPAGPEPIDRNPAAVYLAKLSEGSRRSMRGALRAIVGLVAPGGDIFTFPWAQLRYQHTQAIRAKLCARYRAHSTINRHISALRGVLKETWRLGYMSAEDFHRASDIPSVRGSRLPAGRALDAGEIRVLFAVCDPETPKGARDAALLGVLYGAGIRRSEVANLDLVQFHDESGEMKVLGKGGKERLVFAPNGALEAIKAWLRFRGAEPGPLFHPFRRGGHIRRRRMTDQGVYVVVNDVAQRAGVRAFTPHDMRRSFISDLLDAGADISTVQQLAGHASPTTTGRYDRRGDRAKKKAAELLHVPFASKPASPSNPARHRI